jgi:hypothetical protein
MKTKKTQGFNSATQEQDQLSPTRTLNKSGRSQLTTTLTASKAL